MFVFNGDVACLEPISLGVTFTARVHALSSPQKHALLPRSRSPPANPFAQTTQPAPGRGVQPSRYVLAPLSDPTGTARPVSVRVLEVVFSPPSLWDRGGTEPTRSTSGGQSLRPDAPPFAGKWGSSARRSKGSRADPANVNGKGWAGGLPSVALNSLCPLCLTSDDTRSPRAGWGRTRLGGGPAPGPPACHRTAGGDRGARRFSLRSSRKRRKIGQGVVPSQRGGIDMQHLASKKKKKKRKGFVHIFFFPCLCQ